jgi:hypothetical protein
MKDRNIKQVLSGGWYSWERGEHKERVKQGTYGGNTIYSCMKCKNEIC